MKNNGFIPNDIIYNLILKICAETKNLKLGTQIHNEMQQRGIIINLELNNTLISMYAKCGKFEEAEQLVNKMIETDKFSYGAMISCSAKYGKGEKSIELFEEMTRTNFKPNAIIFISLLTGL